MRSFAFIPKLWDKLAACNVPHGLAIVLCCGVLSAFADTNPVLSKSETAVLKRLGGHVTQEGKVELGGVTIDVKSKTLSFPATLNMSKGPVEVLVCTKRGRLHESLFASDIDPFKLQMALVLVGAKNGQLTDDADKNSGDRFHIDLVPANETGKSTVTNRSRIPVEKWIINSRTGKSPKRTEWMFVGSSFHPQRGCMATLKGNLININSMDLDTILSYPIKVSHRGDFFHINAKEVDKTIAESGVKEGADLKVTVILTPVKWNPASLP